MESSIRTSSEMHEFRFWKKIIKGHLKEPPQKRYTSKRAHLKRGTPISHIKKEAPQKKATSKKEAPQKKATSKKRHPKSHT